MNEEHRAAISKARTGQKTAKRSAASRKKMSDAKARWYVLVSPIGKAYTVNSEFLKKACIVFGLKYAGLMASKLKNRPYKGWVLVEINTATK